MALQALYQWLMTDENLNAIELQFLTHPSAKKIDQAYFQELLHTIPQKLESIEAQFEPALALPKAELDPIELSILRISNYELLYRKDIPYKVIINEALELAKKFGSVEGYKFINGVLDKVAKTARAGEK
ncbi:MAG: transcription antitermination factor NusB [Gammaproteobacteria bacterium]|nr:transcription antitermination factor NusB [Gammaproteobacteria bacterium]